VLAEFGQSLEDAEDQPHRLVRMSDQSDPVAYSALAKGTPVQSADGREFGTLEAVLEVDEVDVFDGLIVKTDQGHRFVDAEDVASIYASHVVTNLSAEQAAQLPAPAQTPTYDADAEDDTGRSAADRFGRMFGRGKWKRERH
jgi:hypothetical protein